MINLRDFRIGWRLLIGEPIYSVVVIAGLTLSLAACFLLLAMSATRSLMMPRCRMQIGFI